MSPAPSATDVLLRVCGTVQGVGFRPFVHCTAHRLGIHGWVRNDAQGVLIRAAGSAPQLDTFVATLERDAPPAAHVTGIDRQLPGPDDAPPGPDFEIVRSGTGGAVTAAVPADLALCADCRRELLDPDNRRFQYPFINCTQCGPRYSIIEQLPYDRPRTTMKAFRMCPECRREYHQISDRRYHAEPNACPACGPQLLLTDAGRWTLAADGEALSGAASALRHGLIVAVKGIGGYHLMCDATNESAVATLRTRKHREEKPLAVMFRDLRQAQDHAAVTPAAARLLQSARAPIVLILARADRPLAPSIAPGNPWIGAVLPYTPLHVLLLAACRFPLVATSANPAEEPLCTDNAEARERLALIADLFLEHDRPIARPIDDSVVRLSIRDEPILLRRARGYAPAPLELPDRLPEPVLCAGGQLKSTVAVAAGSQLVLSPHLGDLDNAATRRVFEQTAAMLATLFQSPPTRIIHDKHPDYASTRYAIASGLPCVAVQHHLAHVLACLLEHRHPADGVLGVAWDGTGYGEDGTVWGGEFILLQQNRAERFARLRPFRLPGGEAAARDARRVALALAYQSEGWDTVVARLGVSPEDAANFETMLKHGLNSPVCSSMGRLFDAASALLGLGKHNAYEGQLPLALEAAAMSAVHEGTAMPFPVRPAIVRGARLEVDWEPALMQLQRTGVAADRQAAAFHCGLAQAIVNVATQAGVGTVALTGGCFQNALLHSLACDALTVAGFKVLVHRELSPNDNSIAAGQAMAALLNLTSVDLPD